MKTWDVEIRWTYGIETILAQVEEIFVEVADNYI